MFWVLLWLSSAGCVVYLLCSEFIHFYEYPTTVTVTGRMADELEFPAITICNLASRNKSMFSNDTRTRNYYLSSSVMQGQPINWSDPFYLREGYFEKRTMQDLYDESKNISTFIRFHRFDLKPYELTFTPVATDLGLCARSSPVVTKLFGGFYNLHVYINLHLDEDYYSLPYHSSGIKVAVHNKNDVVLMANEGFVVPPATEAFVEISRKESRYLALPYKAFENDVCHHKDPSYTASKCLMECYRQKIQQNCSCVHFMFESNDTYCSKEAHLTCFGPTYLNLIRNSVETCDCPSKCLFTTYDASVSFGMFPSSFMGPELAAMLNSTEEYFRKNYISLRIHYKTLQTTVTEQKAKYENYGDVLSNIGGQMGLFLGASILTVTELCELIMFILRYCPIYLFKRNKVEHGNDVYMSEKIPAAK